MLPSLPTFLSRFVLKSIDCKLWLGRLPSLPILKARVYQNFQQSLADIAFCRESAKEAETNHANICWFCWQIILYQGHANNAKKLVKKVLKESKQFYKHFAHFTNFSYFRILQQLSTNGNH